MEGKKGYLCPGMETHFYGMWVAGPARSSDVVSRDMSFEGAASELAEHIRTGRIFI